jgi:hypothetical protein
MIFFFNNFRVTFVKNENKGDKICYYDVYVNLPKGHPFYGWDSTKLNTMLDTIRLSGPTTIDGVTYNKTPEFFYKLTYGKNYSNEYWRIGFIISQYLNPSLKEEDVMDQVHKLIDWLSSVN